MVSGGVEHCRPDYHIRRSGLRYLSIEFVAAGEGSLQLAGKKHALSAGDIFAYGPRIPHDIQSDPDRPLVKYFVDFAGKKARRLMNSPGASPGRLVQTSNPPHILRLFEDLIGAGLRSTPFRLRICSAITEHLLLRIAETSVAPWHRRHGGVRNLSALPSVYCRPLSGPAWTGRDRRQCHLDASYLCRLFERFDYESPYQYLTRLKMLHAAERLQLPGAMVKQVAGQLGFADPFRFSRTFSRVLGMSPKKFARMRSIE